MFKIEAVSKPTSNWITNRKPEFHQDPRQALRSELLAVQKAWGQYQRTRDRFGVYKYLEAVFSLVNKWRKQGRANSRAREALQLHGLAVGERLDPFAAVITCSAKAHRRTIDKWSRVLRYYSEAKTDTEGLIDFLQHHGGVEKCAAQMSGKAKVGEGRRAAGL